MSIKVEQTDYAKLRSLVQRARLLTNPANLVAPTMQELHKILEAAMFCLVKMEHKGGDKDG